MIIQELNTNFGCYVDGFGVGSSMVEDHVSEIKWALNKYKFVVIRDINLEPAELENLGSMFGPFADDPYLECLDGYKHVIEVKRDARETTPIFGSDWHSDWSFQKTPPIYTFLYAKKVPPIGGQTTFADCVAAYDRMGPNERSFFKNIRAKHTAVKAYGPHGLFSNDDSSRAMKIKVSSKANEYVYHPLVRTIIETGEKSLFINPVYTVDLLDCNNESFSYKINELVRKITMTEHQFTLSWDVGHLVIWDNRRVIHKAEGGYDGYDRILLRVTIGSEIPK